MKDRKGFTLVELIAVIALLAVILLLIVPNVIDVLRQGRESTFVDQIQSVMRATEKQYGVDLALKRQPGIYCSGEDIFESDGYVIEYNYNNLNNTLAFLTLARVPESNNYNSGPCMPLDINLSNAKYVAVVDDYGVIRAIGVQDKNYCYVTSNPSIEVNKKLITKGKLTCSDGYCSCGYDEKIYVGYMNNNNGGGVISPK